MRKVLSADKVFQHTGLKQKSETVWRLDQVRSHKRQLLSGAGYGVLCQGLKQKSETVCSCGTRCDHMWGCRRSAKGSSARRAG